MKGSYLAVVALVLIVFGLLLYPTVREMIGLVDISGLLPLTQAAVTSLPYLFLGFVIYGIYQQAKR